MNPTALGSGARMLNAYALRAARPSTRASAAPPRTSASSFSRARPSRAASATPRPPGRATSRPTGTSSASRSPPGSHGAVRHALVDDRHRRLRDAAQVGAAGPEAEDVEEWRELYTRWFQYGAFCPLLRVHGQFPYREMWHFGGEEHRPTRRSSRFDELRYRLLPYIYSLAAAVTREHDTMLMRPLVMEFRRGPRGHATSATSSCSGPAFLVSPVTAPGATRREVYLPRDPSLAARATGDGWYDFWTRRLKEAGRASAPGALRVAAGATCAPARSCRSAPSSSTRARSRPTRSRSASTRAATAASRSTRTTARATRYEQGAVRDDPAPLGRGEGHADDRDPRRVVPGDARRSGRSASCSSPKDAAIPHSAAPEAARTRRLRRQGGRRLAGRARSLDERGGASPLRTSSAARSRASRGGSSRSASSATSSRTRPHQHRLRERRAAARAGPQPTRPTASAPASSSSATSCSRSRAT